MKSALKEWIDDKQCSCVHPDAGMCADWRSGLELDDPDYERKHWKCECCCHSEGDYDEEED